MIERLCFSHIRSYGEHNEIEFAIPLGNRLGLTVFVGRNNAGKSTILRIISDAFDEKPNMVFDKLDRKEGKDPTVNINFFHKDLECRLALSKAASAYFKKEITKKEDGAAQHVPGVANKGDPFVCFVPSRRPWNDSFNAEGRANPNLQQFEQTARVSRNPNQLADLGIQLNMVLSDGKKKEFDVLLKSVIPDINDWTTDRIAGQDRIVYQSKSGVEHAISDSGDGVVSLFRICFALLRYPDNVPLLLDEPELSLHPEAQKRLYNLIVETSKRRQVIVSTHSPHFVEWKDIAEGARVYRVAQGEDGVSRIFSPESETFSKVFRAIGKDLRNRKLYDYLAKEMFFQSSIVFLEGQEDVHLLSAFLEAEHLEMLPLFSYGAGGAGNIRHLLRLACELGLRAVGVYDGNEKTSYESATEEFEKHPDVFTILLSKNDIRDKYKRDGKCAIDGKCHETDDLLIEGFFDRAWGIKEEMRGELLSLVKEISRVRTCSHSKPEDDGCGECDR